MFKGLFLWIYVVGMNLIINLEVIIFFKFVIIFFFIDGLGIV